MNKKQKIITGAVSIIAITFFCWYFFSHEYSLQGNKIKKISIGNFQVYAEVVEDRKKLELGLGGREKMCKYCGMLFVFNEKGRQNFWMKGMHFPIDILWMDGKKIVHIERNVSPYDQRRVYSSEIPSDKVLELPAGTCDKENIKKRDVVNFD
jgi:uncharacterized membrane protein (UPF0127 family)